MKTQVSSLIHLTSVERSLRAFDEEFYRVYLLNVKKEKEFLSLASRWVYF
jgi:hypothetical protein